MDSNDVRNRFRANGRRDYVGPMPATPTSPESRQTTAPEPFAASEEFEQEPDLFLPEEPTKVKKQKKPKGPKKARSKKKIIIFSIVLLVISGAAFGVWKYKYANNSGTQEVSISTTGDNSNPVQQLIDSNKKKTVRLVATGDMIAHDTILAQGKTASGKYDFSPMLANMKPFFAKSDVNFCNQATPAGGEALGLSGYPIFNAPLEWTQAIEGVGCNVINIGTNHTNDKGQGLVDATVAAWDNRPNVLAVVGANRSAEEQSKIRYFEKDGIKFAVLSYSTYSNTPITNGFAINMYNKDTATKQVVDARKNADIVLVSMRWGTEYSPGVDATQEVVSQELADAGATIVFGHGPHFLEPVKILKGKTGNETLVWYSLGNFLNTQLETEALIGGFAIVDIDLSSRNISDPMFMPVYSHYEWTPAQKAANDLLARNKVMMYPLDQAAEPLSRSQLGTTVEAQTDRVSKILNTYTPVKIIKSDQF